jgi:hypothetical protein
MPFAKNKARWTMLRRRGRRRRRWTTSLYNSYKVRKMMAEAKARKTEYEALDCREDPYG